MSRERRAPAPRADDRHGAHTRAPTRRSVPEHSLRRFARWRKRRSAPVAAAANTTARGAPASHAAGGRARVAATEPSDTYRVIQTVTRNSDAAIAVAPGASTLNTPAATATP